MTLLIQFHESCDSFEGHLPAEKQNKFEHLVNRCLYIPFLDLLQKTRLLFSHMLRRAILFKTLKQTVGPVDVEMPLCCWDDCNADNAGGACLFKIYIRFSAPARGFIHSWLWVRNNHLLKHTITAERAVMAERMSSCGEGARALHEAHCVCLGYDLPQVKNLIPLSISSETKICVIFRRCCTLFSFLGNSWVLCP